jgi:hypothetical protein
VRPLGPLRLVVAPPACGPAQDTFMTSSPRLDHFARGRPPLLTARWPRATGLTSYLSGCLWLTSQRCRFWHRRRFGSFSPGLPGPSGLPGSSAPFVPPFGVFRWADPDGSGPPEPPVPCWLTVATVYPLGNCDSPGPETSPDYLTRLGTASHCSWPRSSCFASLTARESRQRSW